MARAYVDVRRDVARSDHSAMDGLASQTKGSGTKKNEPSVSAQNVGRDKNLLEPWREEVRDLRETSFPFDSL